MRGLRHPNYRLFFVGQLVSLCGTWMTIVATGWLVYRLTGSALLLGVVTFAGQIPVLLLGPFAGLVADRVDQRRALVILQTLSMLQSFALAALTLAGHPTMEALIALNLLQGIITAIDIPMRQAFLVRMIEDRADLGNAIALNSSMFNAARIAGPALGAVVIAAAGEGWCFFLDGCSFLAVIASFLLMKISPPSEPSARRGVRADFLDGWHTVSRPGPIRRIIGLLAVVSLLGAPYLTLMPLFARTILQGDAHTLGLLMGASGAGAFGGAAWLAGRRSILGLGLVIPCAAGIFALSIIGFAWSRTLWVSLLFLFAGGCSLMIQLAASNTILQTIVEDERRGRVMSFYMMAVIGMAPFGSLIMGSLSEQVGASLTISLGGALCVGAAVWFFTGLEELRAAMRPIYRRVGILPEATNAANEASRLSFEARD
ncbi:MAG: MFS transporter [Chthoniobacterales bacterium]